MMAQPDHTPQLQFVILKSDEMVVGMAFFLNG